MVVNREGIGELKTILSNLRQRIELEDDDFHYDSLLLALDQILALLEVKDG